MRRRTKYTINQPVAPLTLFPVIDLRGRASTPADDLQARATRWADEGAAWLHLVLADARALGALPALTSSVAVAVQVESAWATPDEIDRALDGGAGRVVVAPDTEHAAELLRDGVARHSAERFVARVSELAQVEPLKVLGVARLLLKVEHDPAGSPIAILGEFAQKSGVPIIAEVEVASLEALHRLRWVQPFGVEGVLLGDALDEGRFTLAEAAAALAESLPEDARSR